MRYHTPVGPIRLDFSYNLNPPIYPVNVNYSQSDIYAQPARGRGTALQLLFQLRADILMNRLQTSRFGEPYAAIGCVCIAAMLSASVPASRKRSTRMRNPEAASHSIESLQS